MVDIHSHYLPGLDDGAKSMEVALEMLEMAAADGTTHIVGSPHSNYEYEYSLERNRALAAELQAAVGDKIALLTGCDFHLSFENLERVTGEPEQYTVNQGKYLLTEFASHNIPPGIENQFHQLRMKGLIPIITHPERVPELMEHRFDLLVQLVEMGCPVQVTGGSLLGRFGEPAQQACLRLLRWNMVHIVASDAHDTRHRPPTLSPARQWVAESMGEAMAEALFLANPRAVIDSKPLPFQPEPRRPKKKRRFGLF